MLPLNNGLEPFLCQKLTEHITTILHPKFERKSIQGRYFITLWFLNKVVWLVLAAKLEGILLPSNMAVKTTFCIYLVKRLLVTLRCPVNVTTSSFQHFLWSLSAKFAFKKEVINSFKKSHFGHVTSYELTHFKKTHFKPTETFQYQSMFLERKFVEKDWKNFKGTLESEADYPKS